MLTSFAIFVLSCPVYAAPFPKATLEPTPTTPYNISTSHWHPSSQVLQARKADPGIGTPEGVDLDRAGNPSMRHAGTFYRAAVERELAELRAAVGGASFDMETAQFGDFNVGDTPHMYLFPNEISATEWCAALYKKNPVNIRRCAVVKFKWVPPQVLKLQRFKKGTKAWQKVG